MGRSGGSARGIAHTTSIIASPPFSAPRRAVAGASTLSGRPPPRREEVEEVRKRPLRRRGLTRQLLPLDAADRSEGPESERTWSPGWTGCWSVLGTGRCGSAHVLSSDLGSEGGSSQLEQVLLNLAVNGARRDAKAAR